MSIYLDYFGLQEAAFSITPDPRYIYLSSRHEDALAHLLYGIGQGGSGGFVQLTGEVGTGKTTLCRCLLEQIPDKTRIALILNPMLKPRDLLQAICDELRIQHGRSDSSRELVNRLYQHLLKAHADGERVVLVIDEAQNMSRDALEQVRLLTNLETHTDKLLQIILLGQPELRELLARQELRQLAQRITARYHLQPLDSDATEAYVKHRLMVAGCKRPLFKRSGYKALYQLSGGVPRLINILADRALLGAYASEIDTVNGELVKQASREINGDYQTNFWNRFNWFGLQPWLLASLFATLLVSVSYAAYRMWPEAEQQASIDSAAVSDVQDNEVAAVSDQVSATVSSQPLIATDQTQWPKEAAQEPVALADVDIKDWLNTASPTGVWLRWAELWGLDQQRINVACAQADGDDKLTPTGVFCTRQPGGWSRIRQLNLPVLIEFKNHSAPVLIEGIQSQQVLINNGQQSRWWAFTELLDQWSGGYMAVCPGSTQVWREGMRDGEIQRLKGLAAGLLEQPYKGVLDDHFDTQFATWVASFQTRNGLTSDRILGQESKLFLCAGVSDTPQLRTVSDVALLIEGG